MAYCCFCGISAQKQLQSIKHSWPRKCPLLKKKEIGWLRKKANDANVCKICYVQGHWADQCNLNANALCGQDGCNMKHGPLFHGDGGRGQQQQSGGGGGNRTGRQQGGQPKKQPANAAMPAIYFITPQQQQQMQQQQMANLVDQKGCGPTVNPHSYTATGQNYAALQTQGTPTYPALPAPSQARPPQ